ncbi:MAG: mechanosensitive ion channel family protein [Actinomycetota bacterium]|nr:mechanosensitive ion channel family protein [Actinomycetota bacterium]
MLAQQSQVVSHGLGWGDWILALVIVTAGFALGQAARRLVVRALSRGDSGRSAAQAVGRLASSILVTGGFVYALSAIGVRLGPLVGALGIGGLALAFAGQSILANFMGSIILQIRRPFRAGDQVSLGGCEGTVQDIDFRTVVLRSFDGDRVLVPCAAVLTAPIINHTVFGRRRTTLEIGVGYDADLDTARRLLLDVMGGVDDAASEPRPEVWVKQFDDSSVALELRFWHQPDVATLWRVRSEVAVAAKLALDAAGISIAFPQRVVRLVTDPDGAAPRPGRAGTAAE